MSLQKTRTKKAGELVTGDRVCGSPGAPLSEVVESEPTTFGGDPRQKIQFITAHGYTFFGHYHPEDVVVVIENQE